MAERRQENFLDEDRRAGQVVYRATRPQWLRFSDRRPSRNREFVPRGQFAVLERLATDVRLTEQ